MNDTNEDMHRARYGRKDVKGAFTSSRDASASRILCVQLSARTLSPGVFMETHCTGGG